MTACLNSFAPSKYRAATVCRITNVTEFFLSYTRTANAEYSADIAVFCTSSRLIGSLTRYMEMPAALAFKMNSVSCSASPPCADLLFSIYLNLITGKPFGVAVNKLSITCQGINNNIHIRCYVFLPAFIGVIHTVTVKVIVTACSRIVTRVIFFIPFPCLYRNRNECMLTCSIYIACTLNSEVKDVFASFVCCISCRETIKSFNLIVNPCVNIVKVKSYGNLIDILHVVCNDIYPVLRACEYHIGNDLGYYLNCSIIAIALNVDLSDNRSIVACLITDSELNSMYTVSKCSSRNRDLAAVKLAIDLITVNVCLYAGSVKTCCVNICGIFSYRNTEADIIVIGNRCFLTLIIKEFIFTCNRLYISNFSK